jgi:hypothetical protein
MNWRKRIKRGEKIGLELTQTERKLLLTGLVFLHKEVEEAIRSNPPADDVRLTVSDLEFLGGHVAGEPTMPRANSVRKSSAASSIRSRDCLTYTPRRDNS